MPESGQRKYLGLAAGLIVVVVGLAMYYRWYSSAPPPTQMAEPIAAGGVARFLVTPKTSGIRGRRRSPHHFEFASTAGPVDVYVLPANAGYRAQDREEMDTLTAEFAAGQVPPSVVAKSEGQRGRIDLADWSQVLSRERPSYLVLVRSASETEVTLVVHYGP